MVKILCKKQWNTLKIIIGKGEIKTSLISTISSLLRELKRIIDRDGDDFITVKIKGDDREYIIDSIAHEKTHTDSNITHLCLLCRDGGQGNIKR